jgi:hypothetical protein
MNGYCPANQASTNSKLDQIPNEIKFSSHFLLKIIIL